MNNSFSVHAIGMTDIGRKREKNEDNFSIQEDLALFIVADGMGGHAGGETASRLAVSTVRSVVLANHDILSSPVEPSEPIEEHPAAKLLSDALRCACQQIFQQSERDVQLHGMGTTTTALLFAQDRGYVAHVGDSRAYLIRSDQMVQLSEDHSLVNEQLKAGLISQSEAKTSRYRNVITRSIGFEEDVDVDMTTFEAQKGDRYLLCSDGLTTMLGDEEILSIVRHKNVDEAARELIEQANRHGGDDNITVILAELY